MKKIAVALVAVAAAAGVGGVMLYRKKGAQVAAPNNAGGGIPFAIDNLGGQVPMQVNPAPVQNSFLSNVVDTVSNILEPRGIRNKNPLNIKWASVNNWVGQVGKDSGGFSIFDKPENGIRAAAKILDSYARRGIVTIADIVKTWAPAADNNNVEAYTNHVTQAMGKARTYKITRADYLPLLRVMIKHENGKNPYTDSQILAGINAS